MIVNGGNRTVNEVEMQIDVLTLFPAMFEGPLSDSMMGAARLRGLLDFQAHDIRNAAEDAHRSVDDTPYGGGGGMILRVDVLTRALETLQPAGAPVILLTPQGRTFSHQIAREFSTHDRLILVCGHYEGVDERFRQQVSDEISIGDYVLTGGELAAMVVIDAVVRLQPGLLGAEHAATQDSFATGLLEGPHYTRPREFRGESVPDVMLSGHHAEIERWRRKQALRRTWERRPELLKTAPLSEEDASLLGEFAREWSLLRLAGER